MPVFVVYGYLGEHGIKKDFVDKPGTVHPDGEGRVFGYMETLHEAGQVGAHNRVYQHGHFRFIKQEDVGQKLLRFVLAMAAVGVKDHHKQVGAIVEVGIV